MAFNVRYRIEFTTKLNRSVKIDFEEDGTWTIANLVGADVPLEIESQDGSFNKTTAIRQQTARIRFISTDTVTIDTFALKTDKETKVKIYVENNLEWVGWLYTDNINRVLTDRGVVVELEAKDGLHLLPSAKLTDLSSNEVWDLKNVKDWITFCLDKTDLDLDWYAFNNAYQVGSPARNSTAQGDSEPFFWEYITSQSFLVDARGYDDPLTVLEKILEAHCFTLFQARGAWWVISLNDRIAGDLDGTQYNASGVAQTALYNQSYQVALGLTRSQKFINGDAVTGIYKPIKKLVVDYPYNYPAAFFRNFDLQEGTINIIKSTAQRDVLDIANWDELIGQGYIGKEVDANGFETFRYLFLEPQSPFTTSSVQPKVRTSRFYVPAGVKLSISFQQRERNATPRAGGGQHCTIRLDVPGGNFYSPKMDGKWGTVNVEYGIGYTYGTQEARDIWRDYSLEVEPTPFAGYLTIIFWAVGSNLTSGNEVRFKDITFDILNPLVNNDISVKGIEYTTEQASEYSGEQNQSIYIADSRNIGISGALVNSTYGEIAKVKYYSAADNTAVPHHQFVKRVYWKAVYRNYQRLEGRILNLVSSRLLSLLNTFTVDGIANKEFIPTTFRMDVRNEFVEMALVEVRNTSNTNDFDALNTEASQLIDPRAERFEEPNEELKPISFRWGVVGYLVSRAKRRKQLKNRNPYG